MKLALCVVFVLVFLPATAVSQPPLAVSGWYNSPHAFPVLRIHVNVSGDSAFVDSIRFFALGFAMGYADSSSEFCTIEAYSSFPIVYSPPAAIGDACFVTSPVIAFREGDPRYFGNYSISGCFTTPGSMTAQLMMEASETCTQSTPVLTLTNNQPTAVATPPSGAGPMRFQLFQNYPNPFNPTTSIEYALPRRMQVTVRIYDILGRPVALLLDGESREEGINRVVWNAAGVGNGVYYCRVQAGEFTETRKLILLQ